MTDTVDLKCPKCGRWLTEVGTFGRAKCCGYQITVEFLRGEKDRQLTGVPSPS